MERKELNGNNMKNIGSVIAIGIAVLFVTCTVVVLAVFKPGVRENVVPTTVIEESSVVETTATETIESSEEEDVPPLTVSVTESVLEFADRVASSKEDEFVIITPDNGRAYYQFDISVLNDSSWLPDMSVFKLLLEDNEYVYDMEESDIVIHYETYVFDGEVASVDFTATFPSGNVARYTLCVDITHRIIYSNY